MFPLLGGTESRPTWRGEEIDAKLAAVRYLAHLGQGGPIIWVEDGFAKETRAWAGQRGQVHLVDTTLPEIQHALLTTPNTEEAAAVFVERYIYAGKGHTNE